MATLKAGWTECAIRRWPVPVAVLDARSTYMTLATLLGVQDVLFAERMEIADSTAETEELLRSVELSACLDPRLWRGLWTLVRVKPDRDLLPVKTRLSRERQWDLLFAITSGKEPLWVHMADAINAKLLTGRVPRVVRSVTFRPVGRLAGLRSTFLRGEVEVDPERPDSLFRASVEAREAAHRRADPESRRLEGFLKTFGNGGVGFGKTIEYRRRVLARGTREKVTVYGSHDKPFEARLDAPEEPGPWCYPMVGATVAASAHLVLGLIERLVRDRGGCIAYRDTDSAFVVATKEGGDIACPGGPLRLADGRDAIRALSWSEVDEVVKALVPLNPFDRTFVPGSVLKLEDENFDPKNRERIARSSTASPRSPTASSTRSATRGRSSKLRTSGSATYEIRSAARSMTKRATTTQIT